MRGTLIEPEYLASLDGIIPAHAGNTQERKSLLGFDRDHPRACGEHLCVAVQYISVLGSSPRMRGTRTAPHQPGWAHGIIPAHAGNTPWRSLEATSARDHPRACGEHNIAVFKVSNKAGSSPRMRGTLIDTQVGGKIIRIIPAHAGNTSWSNGVRCRPRDHPRACGEHILTTSAGTSSKGSSPRMRGTRTSKKTQKFNLGIIPAHAGNTSSFFKYLRNAWDHPRACGEHVIAVAAAAVILGSSPRMRGTHFEISTIPRFLDSFCLFFIQFHFEYFFACRYLLALLHPRRRAPPKDTSFALDGRLTSSNPSQSVGDQSAPCTLNARCCSFLAE